MPQMGTADVTYTHLTGTSLAAPCLPMREAQYTMLFPNGSNTLYTSGGIPVAKSQLGCPATVQKFIIEDMGSTVGYVAKWDQAANTIRLYVSQNTTAASTGTVLAEVSTAATVSSTTLRVLVAGW